MKAKPIDVWEGSDIPKFKRGNIVNVLAAGDKVRIFIKKGIFDKKSILSNWTREVYTIKGKVGNLYELEERDGRYPRWVLRKEKIKRNRNQVAEQEQQVPDPQPDFDLVQEHRELRRVRNVVRELKREEMKQENVVNNRLRDVHVLPEGYFEAEKILASKYDKKKRRRVYLVKWKGYDESENSWEPKSHVTKTLLDDWKNKHK